MKLSVDIDDAGGLDAPVSVDVARVRSSGHPYLASPYFTAWPGGGARTAGVIVTVKIGATGPMFPEPVRTINAGA
jgi:hypothetical protein